MHVQGEAVIHYGRSCFTKANIPVFTVLPKTELDVNTSMKSLQDNFKSDELDNLCLFYDAEFEHCKGTKTCFSYCLFVTYKNMNPSSL